MESYSSPKKESIPLPKPDEVLEEENVEVAVSVLQMPVEKSDEKCEEEAESNLRSLLCEETIPGSPAPPSDSAQAIEPCHKEPEESKTTVLEMPFASAPGSNCTSSSSNGKLSAAPIFSSPVMDSSPAIVPITLGLSAPIQMQTGTTTASPTISSPPPQVQVQPPAVSVAGPGPGSGLQGPGPGVSKRNSNDAAPVMDNTPPTTPDSSLSTISGSPRE